MSRDALQQRLTVYATAAGNTCPTLTSKNVTPHVLRHSAAMALLHSGVDITVIALWLGHESVTTTQIYRYKPTWHSSSKPSTGPPRPPAPPAATSPPTGSSRSSKPCDYADTASPVTPVTSSGHLRIGITTVLG